MNAKNIIICLLSLPLSLIAAPDITEEHINLFGTNSFSSAAANDRVFFWQPSKYAFRAGRALNNDNFKNNLIGSYSTALGYDVRSSGSYSFSSGYASQSLSTASVSIGYSTYSSGFGSVALGFSTRATGTGSFAAGMTEGDMTYTDTQATSEGSIALGTGVIASGLSSFATGMLNVSSGSQAASMGYGNLSSGYTSITAGYYNDATYSYGGAFGVMSESLAATSFVLGRNLISRSQDATVVGFNNEPIKTTNNNSDSDRPIFVVGNGTSTSNRSNAFVVRANGVIEGNGSGLTGLAGGQILTSGSNVGVGISPAVKLDVNGVVAVGSNTAIGSGSEIGRFAFYSRDASSGASGSRAYIRVVNDSGATWNGTAANEDTAMEFHTTENRTTDRMVMRLTSQGNVGIGTGTTAPAAKLHVAGSAQVDGNLTVNGGIVLARSGDVYMGVFGLSGDDYPPNP